MEDADTPHTLLQIPQQQPSVEWLRASQEDVVEQDLPIIDAHHHFSEHWGGYMPDDLLADGQGHRIDATVYVQCGWRYHSVGADALRPIGETESVVAVTREVNRRQHRTQVAAAIVGYADLCLGAAVEEVLAAHVAAGEGRFRGIRNSGAYHPTFKHGVLPRPMQGLYRNADFRRGYAQLARHGLSFDAWIYHPQLEDVYDLAVSFPDTTLILDHIGGVLGVAEYSGQALQARDEWLPWIRKLSECPNVYVKLGGLGTAVFGYNFALQKVPPLSMVLANSWRPWMEPVIEQFGAKRCMFESNFPVDRSAASYGVVWNAFKRLVSGVSMTEKHWLFHHTAAHVYQVTPVLALP